MQQEKLKIYGYRWVVLLAFMAVIFVNQMLWITFASITGPAARFYGVSDLAIAFLSLSFMLVYIVVSIPASWVIDTYGIRVGVGIGAVLTGVFGLMRGLLAADYTTVLIAQIGIAVGQPFLLNAITKVAARWFPLEDRATASGLGTLSMYGGQVVALALTPLLLTRPGHACDAARLRRDRGRRRGRVPDLCPGASADAGFARRRRSALAGLRWHAADPAQPGLPLDDGHLLHRTGGLQRRDDLDRGHRPAAGLLHHPGRADRRADGGRRGVRRARSCPRSRIATAAASRSSCWPWRPRSSG